MSTAQRVAQHVSIASFTNPCESDTDHGLHTSHVIEIDATEIEIFDWAKYQDTKGFCPGDDAVSQSLEITGGWEPHITALIALVFDHSDRGLFIDIGAHLGWYSMLALSYGNNVLAVEPSAEYRRLLERNIKHVKPKGTEYLIEPAWIDSNIPMLTAESDDHILLIKIDIEGNERHAIRLFSDYLDKHLVDYLVMEVSPVFNDSYGALILTMLQRGYRCWRIDATRTGQHEEWTVHNITEKLAEEPQVDVFFQSPDAKPIL